MKGARGGGGKGKLCSKKKEVWITRKSGERSLREGAKKTSRRKGL